MKPGNLTAAIAASVVLTGCVSGFDRMMSYPQTLSGDAKVSVGGRGYKLWFHRKDRTVIIQRAGGAAFGHALAEGVSLGTVRLTEAEPYWRAAAMAVLGPLGCKIDTIYQLEQRTTWEASYSCPEGVDPRQLAVTERATWLRGVAAPDPYADAK